MTSQTSKNLIRLFILLFPGTVLNGQSRQSFSTNDLNMTLSIKDSLFFKAIAICNIGEIENTLTTDFVFYQDNGYRSRTTAQSKKEFVENINKNFCSNGSGQKLRRELVKESLQVSPINNDAAVQLGVQRFYVMLEGNKEQLVEESKFSREWQKKNGQWKIARELDYLVNARLNNVANHSDGLYNEIAHMDSLLFDAFNNRDIEKFKTLFTTDLEFYHDKAGLTGYDQSIESLKNTAAQNNGLRRELVKGSLEVYPIKDYGAIQIGAHTFCHPENGKMDCGTFKFVHIWKKTGNEWKITRVVSYDH